ncbi:MAG TPA: hypothetical protein VEX13_03205 [Chloroflexia bacterium]|nr:hypothetical protein [Chloroflexia bacterium]
MAFTKDKFTLFWSLPPDELDWQNLRASRARRVMMPFNIAFSRQDVLSRLRQEGRRVVLRIEEHTYSTDGAPAAIRSRFRTMRQLVNIDAVIIGCEPDDLVPSLEYGAPSWGQDHANEHQFRLDRVRAALQPEGVTLVSPGLMMRSISEDDAPQPGKVTWREIIAPAYNKCDGNGVHIYGHKWESFVDALRAKFALKQAMELFHKPLWIDECGFGLGTETTAMNGWISFAGMIMAQPRLAARVEMICPFVSNGDPGDPPVWPRRYLVRDTAEYQRLGTFLA